MVFIHSPAWLAKAALGAACLTVGVHNLNAQADPIAKPLAQESRILGILPNHRTVPSSMWDVPPMSSSEKWRLGTAESFDPFTFLVAGALAGVGQADRTFPSWGQGSKGFSKRYGAALADQISRDYFTEAIFPVLLHDDPRYFRMEHGSFLRRMGYALGRIAVTRTDAGSSRLNYSEFLGSAAAAGLANVYIPSDDRTVGNTVEKFGTQVATDALLNVLKEFWPDVKSKLFHGSGRAGPQSANLAR